MSTSRDRRDAAPAPTSYSASPEKPAAEAEPTEALMDFARSYEPGQRIEMMGGFLYVARTAGWTHATRREWVARYTEFRNRKV